MADGDAVVTAVPAVDGMIVATFVAWMVVGSDGGGQLWWVAGNG